MKKTIAVLCAFALLVSQAFAATSSDLLVALNYSRFTDATAMLDSGVTLTEADFKTYMSWAYFSKFNEYTSRIIEAGGYDLAGTTYSKSLYNSINYSNTELAQFLLDNGVVLNESDFKEYMGWGYMSKYNDYTVKLVEAGQSVKGTTYSKTLYNALNYSNMALAEYLVSKGARMNDSDLKAFEEWSSSPYNASKYANIKKLMAEPVPTEEGEDPNVLGVTTFEGQILTLYKDGTYTLN